MNTRVIADTFLEFPDRVVSRGAAQLCQYLVRLSVCLFVCWFCLLRHIATGALCVLVIVRTYVVGLWQVYPRDVKAGDDGSTSPDVVSAFGVINSTAYRGDGLWQVYPRGVKAGDDGSTSPGVVSAFGVINSTANRGESLFSELLT